MATALTSGFGLVAHRALQIAGVAGDPNRRVAMATSPATAQFSGFLSAGGASLSGLTINTATHSGNLTGTTAAFSGNLTGTTAQFSGLLTGANAVFQTVTVSNLTPTGPNCLQETGGILQATNTGCATQVTTPSIAAGTNITTSGTTANITVNMVPTTPEFAVQYNHAGVLTADTEFTYFSGIATMSLGVVKTTNSQALNITGNWSNSTTTFAAPLFINITTNQFAAGTTNGFGSGSKLLDAQATSISQFAVFPSGTVSTANGIYTANGANNGSVHITTPSVVQFGDGADNANGWYNWTGEGRTTADSVGFITTGFANLITISNLKAGRTYKFQAELPLKSATASTGGVGLRVGGGATATSVVYDGWIVDIGFNGTKGNTQATALSTTVASSSITGTTSHATLIGTITVSAAGSVVLQASGFSTVTAASAVTVGRGATFIAEDIP
jgi:hypothetical protein